MVWFHPIFTSVARMLFVRWDAGLEVFRMQERRGEWEEGCRTGGMQETLRRGKMEEKKKGYGTWKLIRINAGRNGAGKGRRQERRDYGIFGRMSSHFCTKIITMFVFCFIIWFTLDSPVICKFTMHNTLFSSPAGLPATPLLYRGLDPGRFHPALHRLETRPHHGAQVRAMTTFNLVLTGDTHGDGAQVRAMTTFILVLTSSRLYVMFSFFKFLNSLKWPSCFLADHWARLSEGCSRILATWATRYTGHLEYGKLGICYTGFFSSSPRNL